MVKNDECSFRGHDFESQHLYSSLRHLPPFCNASSREFEDLFLTPWAQDTHMVHECIMTKQLYTYNNKNEVK